MISRLLRYIRFGSLLILLAGCSEPPPEVDPVRPVRAIKVGDESAISGRSLPGRAAAAEEVNLSFRVSGPLIQFPVDVGDEVKQGDLLAQIDPTDFRVSLDDAQARLERAQQDLEALRIARPEDIRVAEQQLNASQAELVDAKAEYGRYSRLVKTKAVSRADFDRSLAAFRVAESRVQAARQNLTKAKEGARPEVIAAKQAELRSLAAAVTNAENQLNYTSLTAPFDGTISATFVKNFQTVQANQLIVRLVDTSSIEMTIYVPESGISLVPFVKDITCTFDAFPDQSFAAEVKEVGTEASQTTRTYPLTLRMEQQYAAEGVRILPGMAGRASGRVEIPEGGLEEGVEIPETSIFADGDTRNVWVINETSNKVHRKQVTPGALTAFGVRVPDLSPGQWIATAGVHYLTEGQEVRILDATSKEPSE